MSIERIVNTSVVPEAQRVREWIEAARAAAVEHRRDGNAVEAARLTVLADQAERTLAERAAFAQSERENNL